jgi:hypothetical protein
MRILNDEEISQVLDEVDKLPDFGAYPVYECVEYAAKAQFKRDLKDFIEMMDSYALHWRSESTAFAQMRSDLGDSLKQLVE